MFEDIRANIELLEDQAQKQGSITTEQILESMCKLFEDSTAIKHSVKNTSSFGYKLVNLLYYILPLYAQEKDELLKLNDDDVSEATASCETVANELEQIKPVLKALAEEKARLDELSTQYKAAEKQRSVLQKEVDRIGSISLDEIQSENAALEQKRNELLSRAEELKKIRSVLEEATRDCETLRGQQIENQKQREKAETEVANLEQSVAEYDKWKAAFALKKDDMLQRSTEATASYTAMQTAWSSIRTREDLPQVLSSFEGFSSFNADIKSFNDLERWFDDVGAGIEQAIDTYTKMYRKLLELKN